MMTADDLKKKSRVQRVKEQEFRVLQGGKLRCLGLSTQSNPKSEDLTWIRCPLNAFWLLLIYSAFEGGSCLELVQIRRAKRFRGMLHRSHLKSVPGFTK